MSNDLQHKLFHFESDPPKEVWSRIVESLDAEAEQTFPHRLFTYEEQPPAGSWEKIEAEISEPAIKVVPITKFSKPLRYVAAAASIIAIVFLAINLANKNTATGSVIGGTETVTTTNQSSIIPLNKPNTVVVPDEEQKQAPSVVVPEGTTARTKEVINRRTPASIRPQNHLSAFAFSQGFIPETASKESHLDFSGMEKYMVYSDGDGNAFRVPKKFLHLVYCEDGDDRCKERIRQLQKKMATAAATTDFGGVLEILRQLQ